MYTNKQIESKASSQTPEQRNSITLTDAVPVDAHPGSVHVEVEAGLARELREVMAPVGARPERERHDPRPSTPPLLPHTNPCPSATNFFSLSLRLPLTSSRRRAVERVTAALPAAAPVAVQRSIHRRWLRQRATT